MSTQYQFDATTVEPSQGGGGGLPVSDDKGHLVVIIGDSTKPTRANDGWRLLLRLKVVDGPSAGAEGDYGLNLGNPSAEATRIAHAELSAIMHCIGILRINQSFAELYNRPFRVVVKPQTNEPRYTEVTKVLDANGNPPKAGGPQTAGGAPAAPQPPAGGAQGGWNQPPAGQPAQPQGQPQGGVQGGGWGNPNAPAGPQQPPQGQPAPGGWGQPGGQPPQGAGPQPQQGGGAPGWAQNGQPQNGQPGGMPGWANQ